LTRLPEPDPEVRAMVEKLVEREDANSRRGRP
jgi:hypothetical protein